VSGWAGWSLQILRGAGRAASAHNLRGGVTHNHVFQLLEGDDDDEIEGREWGKNTMRRGNGKKTGRKERMKKKEEEMHGGNAALPYKFQTLFHFMSPCSSL
jgi:hypothetical protein